MEKYFIKNLADKCGCHVDTIYKQIRGDLGCSKKLAKKLAKETGLNWMMFRDPEEFGNPWKILIK
jgi:hypothetical protein